LLIIVALLTIVGIASVLIVALTATKDETQKSGYDPSGESEFSHSASVPMRSPINAQISTKNATAFPKLFPTPIPSPMYTPSLTFDSTPDSTNEPTPDSTYESTPVPTAIPTLEYTPIPSPENTPYNTPFYTPFDTPMPTPKPTPVPTPFNYTITLIVEGDEYGVIDDVEELPSNINCSKSNFRFYDWFTDMNLTHPLNVSEIPSHCNTIAYAGFNKIYEGNLFEDFINYTGYIRYEDKRLHYSNYSRNDDYNLCALFGSSFMENGTKYNIEMFMGTRLRLGFLKTLKNGTSDLTNVIIHRRDKNWRDSIHSLNSTQVLNIKTPDNKEDFEYLVIYYWTETMEISSDEILDSIVVSKWADDELYSLP